MRSIGVVVGIFSLLAQVSATQLERVANIPALDFSSLNVVDGVLYAVANSVVYSSSNNGVSWRRSEALSDSGEFIQTVTFFNGRLYAGTATSGVFTSSNFGASWVQANSGLVGLGSMSITTFARQSGRLIVGTEGAGTFFLNPDMLSWTAFGGLPLNISGSVYAMTTIDDTVIAGAGINGTLYRLVPGSTQWSEILFTGGRNVGAMGFTRMNGELFAVTTNGAYRSSDNGMHWTFAGAGLVNGHSPFIVALRDTLLVTINRLGSTFTFRSTNSGGSWNLESMEGIWTYAMQVHQGKLFVAREDGLWFRPTATTDVGDDLQRPAEVALDQNYPNPFNPMTTIGFTISKESFVSLTVYNAVGEEVESLVNEKLPVGIYSIPFEARGKSSGIYFYRLSTPTFSSAKKMTLVK